MVNSQFCHNAALPKLIPKSISSTAKTLQHFYLIFHNWQEPTSPPKTLPAFTKMKIGQCLATFKAVNFKTEIFAILRFYGTTYRSQFYGTTYRSHFYGTTYRSHFHGTTYRSHFRGTTYRSHFTGQHRSHFHGTTYRSHFYGTTYRSHFHGTTYRSHFQR